MRLQKNRKSCKDVFKSYLVKDARYDENYEMPLIKTTEEIPNVLETFSAFRTKPTAEAWVHFYEDDYRIERVWNRPHAYLSLLHKAKGVILPDFSLYRDMALPMQNFQIYKSRALGHFYAQSGIAVIPNIRWSDYRTAAIACSGIARNSLIAVSTVGMIKDREDRYYFESGLLKVVSELCPHTILVHGSGGESIFLPFKQQGINIIYYPCRLKLYFDSISVDKNCTDNYM